MVKEGARPGGGWWGARCQGRRGREEEGGAGRSRWEEGALPGRRKKGGGRGSRGAMPGRRKGGGGKRRRAAREEADGTRGEAEGALPGRRRRKGGGGSRARCQGGAGREEDGA